MLSYEQGYELSAVLGEQGLSFVDFFPLYIFIYFASLKHYNFSPLSCGNRKNDQFH